MTVSLNATIERQYRPFRDIIQRQRMAGNVCRQESVKTDSSEPAITSRGKRIACVTAARTHCCVRTVWHFPFIDGRVRCANWCFHHTCYRYPRCCRPVLASSSPRSKNQTVEARDHFDATTLGSILPRQPHLQHPRTHCRFAAFF